ncbi:hypothetical protein PQX77_019381 [Marasmius sp. AFHP31]|nr:hypothetical protein PQX77_019381 [Marasmius sp. AFHP31]
MHEADKIEVAINLTEELEKPDKTRHTKIRKGLGARNVLEGETLSKYWTRSNKEQKPRDTINALRKLGTDPNSDAETNYEKDSRKMAELARDYHESLQTQGLQEDREKRERDTQESLNNISAKLSEAQNTEMGLKTSYMNILEALAEAANDSAPGMDGIPYELWKAQ